MKALLLLIGCGVAVFFASLHFVRSILSTPSSAQRVPELHGNRSGAAGDRTASPPPSAVGAKKQARTLAAGMLRVPPGIVQSIELSAFDPLSGDFTSDFQELLELDARELAGTKEAFDAYFKAYTDTELGLTTVVSADQPASRMPGGERLQRFAAIRIDPAGARLKGEFEAMRDSLIERLGRPRGLAAAAMIGRQLGNSGKGGELVAFVRYLGESNYRIEVKGLGDHALSAGSFTSAPIYESPDYSQFARYRHLDALVRK